MTIYILDFFLAPGSGSETQVIGVGHYWFRYRFQFCRTGAVVFWNGTATLILVPVSTVGMFAVALCVYCSKYLMSNVLINAGVRIRKKKK